MFCTPDSSIYVQPLCLGKGHGLYEGPDLKPKTFANYAGTTAPVQRFLARAPLGARQVLVDPEWDCHTGVLLFGDRVAVLAAMDKIEALLHTVLEDLYIDDSFDPSNLPSRVTMFGSDQPNGPWAIMAEGSIEDGFAPAFDQAIGAIPGLTAIDFGAAIDDYAPMDALLARLEGVYPGEVRGWAPDPAVALARSMLAYTIEQNDHDGQYRSMIKTTPKLHALFKDVLCSS